MFPALQADSLPFEPPGKPKNTVVGIPSLLQGIFLPQELNWGLLHCRQILYQLSYKGIPNIEIHTLRSKNSPFTLHSNPSPCSRGSNQYKFAIHLSPFLGTYKYKHICCCSVAQLCQTPCDPMECSMQASLSFTISQSLLKLMSIELVMPSNHLILSSPSPAFSLSQHQCLFQ